MINEIKTIVKNYLNNTKLCCLMTGTVTSSGIQINDSLTIPSSLIVGNLKNTMSTGDSVRLLRDHGGKRYYILEVITE